MMYTEDMVLEREEGDEEMKIYEVKIKGQDPYTFRVEVGVALDSHYAIPSILVVEESGTGVALCMFREEDFEYIRKVDNDIL